MERLGIGLQVTEAILGHTSGSEGWRRRYISASQVRLAKNALRSYAGRITSRLCSTGKKASNVVEMRKRGLNLARFLDFRLVKLAKSLEFNAPPRC